MAGIGVQMMMLLKDQVAEHGIEVGALSVSLGPSAAPGVDNYTPCLIHIQKRGV